MIPNFYESDKNSRNYSHLNNVTIKILLINSGGVGRILEKNYKCKELKVEITLLVENLSQCILYQLIQTLKSLIRC